MFYRDTSVQFTSGSSGHWVLTSLKKGNCSSCSHRVDPLTSKQHHFLSDLCITRRHYSLTIVWPLTRKTESVGKYRICTCTFWKWSEENDKVSGVIFLMSVIKYPTRSNLKDKEFILVCISLGYKSF